MAIARPPASRVIGELPFTDISNLGASSILCLPIGAIEQHGPHLPLNTDSVLAEEFTRLIVSRYGDTFDLWQLPVISLGLSREHGWAPGTVSLSIQTMTALFRDLAREIVRGFPTRTLAIINCHGGNRGILEALAQELRADFGLNLCVLHPTALAEATTDAGTPDIHGGKNETSMMLALAPELVRKDVLAALKSGGDPAAIRKVILDPGVTWPWTTDDDRFAIKGVIGEARAASAEFGKKLVDHAVAAAGPILQELLDNRRRLKS